MKKFAIKLLACVFSVFLAYVLFFYFAFLHNPGKFTKEQQALIIDIRDACGDKIEQAYWLMIDHVAGIVPNKTTEYSDRHPEQWDDTAYALMIEADVIAQRMTGNAERDAPWFAFYSPGLDEWYMYIELKIETGYSMVTLTYWPRERPLSAKYKPIDGHAYWYYEGRSYY